MRKSNASNKSKGQKSVFVTPTGSVLKKVEEKGGIELKHGFQD